MLAVVIILNTMKTTMAILCALIVTIALPLSISRIIDGDRPLLF